MHQVTNGRSTEYPMPPEGFGLRTTHFPDTIEVVLSGELDLSGTPRLKQELTRALERLARGGDMPVRLVIDLQELTFIDSSGIHVLITTKRRCSQHGIELSLQLGETQVRRVLSLAGVAEFLGLSE